VQEHEHARTLETVVLKTMVGIVGGGGAYQCAAAGVGEDAGGGEDAGDLTDAAELARG
jgi:hypothetical protein